MAVILTVCLASLAGCIDGGAGPAPGTPPGENPPVQNPNFDSDDPSGQTDRTATDSNSTPGAGADAGAAAPGRESGESAAAERAIQEADIIQVRGTRLYALSRYGGLSIVDVSVRDRLRLLGRQRMSAIPFEMYVQDNVVYAMMNSFGHLERDATTGAERWVQSSRITALDVQNPAAIREVGSYDVPGDISDSRMVGNVLYLVSYQNGYCWRCETLPATTVASFNVGDPAHMARVDQMTFTAPTAGYSWWRRSVTATTERLYIAGPSWSWDGRSVPHSVIQIVDISDPRGRLVRGADVPVEGQITSRWQMDEYMGVLRVVSQPGNGWWGRGVEPSIQTFRVASSQSVTPLGRSNLVLPRPENLQSVRFDGPRGYAITFQQTDPLFTIDLSDPARPRQVGELEIPGWVYYMEPRGDRLIGLGFDRTEASGSLHVSLFDVSDLTRPRMIQRVNFAPGWANVAEDQDRIHKSFQVLDSLGLIMVPFASYGRWDGTTCTAPSSGIQLIDYGRDRLALRGVAPQHGQPRRAFIHDERLFAVSDRNVSAFQFSDRDRPVKTAEMDLSTPAHRIVTSGAHTIALTNDWWTGEPTLTIYNRADADDGMALGKLNLRPLAPSGASTCGSYGAWAAWYRARLYAHGSYVYVVVPPGYSYYYGPREGGATAPARATIVGVIDLRDPTRPAIVGRLDVPVVRPAGCTTGDCGGGVLGDDYGYGYGYYYYGGGGVLSSGDGIVQHGSTLAFLETSRTTTDYRDPTTARTLRVVDLSAPTRPALTASLDLGAAWGATPLILAGSTVYTSRWSGIPDTPGRVRFWVDRVDLASATAPARLGSVQVPGSLLAAAGPRLVTVSYRRVTAPAASWQDCYRALGQRSSFDYATRTCASVRRAFNLLDVVGAAATLRQTLPLPSENVGRALVADDRIVLGLHPEYDYATDGRVTRPGGVQIFSGIRAGTLALASRIDTGTDGNLVTVRGTRLAISRARGMNIYDAADAAAPRLVASADLRGYGYASDVQLEPDRAVCALGEWGLQTIALR